MKRLSDMMLFASFISTLFYSVSYPYIYAETIKVVPRSFIGIEQILACVGTIIFCKAWNTYGDKLFKRYRLILVTEIVADVCMFADVILFMNLSRYFMTNIIIYSIITKNLCCGCVRMRAKVNPTEQLRERFDNNSNMVCAAATLIASGTAIAFQFGVRTLFVLALIGNTIDNFFYLYIYNRIQVEANGRK